MWGNQPKRFDWEWGGDLGQKRLRHFTGATTSKTTTVKLGRPSPVQDMSMVQCARRSQAVFQSFWIMAIVQWNQDTRVMTDLVLLMDCQ